MEFTKMQGTGNDFIIINNMKLNIPENRLSTIAKRVCQRRLSLGADGFMVVDYPSGKADFKMRFYNSDGSLGEMCGNGARCISRYAYLKNISGKKMKFETGAGIVYSEVLTERMVKVQLNKPEVIVLSNDLTIDGVNYECSYIELGKPGLPHAVVKYTNLVNASDEEICELGRKFRFHESFPKGANINFYEIINNNTAFIKTYERGVEGLTLACGTGSASVAVVLMLKNYLKENKVTILSAGGELTIKVERNNDEIQKLYLIGITNLIAEGKILEEDLI